MIHGVAKESDMTERLTQMDDDPNVLHILTSTKALDRKHSWWHFKWASRGL